MANALFAAAMGVRITVQSLWSKRSRASFVYEFAQSRIVVGRSRSADVQLPHAAVSATHATVRAKGAGYVLVDEGSTNGTRVNEVPLVAGRAKPLKSNDIVDLGGYRLSFEVGVPVATTMSARLTAAFAQEILAEQLALDDSAALAAALDEVQSGRDEAIELLPIPEGQGSEPPPSVSSLPPERGSRSEPAVLAEAPARLGRGAIAVYALAAFVVATSLLAMALLMRS